MLNGQSPDHDRIMLAGAALVAIGAFCPVARIPIVGTVSFMTRSGPTRTEAQAGAALLTAAQTPSDNRGFFPAPAPDRLRSWR